MRSSGVTPFSLLDARISVSSSSSSTSEASLEFSRTTPRGGVKLVLVWLVGRRLSPTEGAPSESVLSGDSRSSESVRCTLTSGGGALLNAFPILLAQVVVGSELAWVRSNLGQSYFDPTHDPTLAHFSSANLERHDTAMASL